MFLNIILGWVKIRRALQYTNIVIDPYRLRAPCRDKYKEKKFPYFVLKKCKLLKEPSFIISSIVLFLSTYKCVDFVF